MGVDAGRFRERRRAGYAVAGESDDQGPVEARLSAELFGQTVAVHIGKTQIEQNQIRGIFHGSRECPRPGGRMFDFMTITLAQ